MSNSRIFIDSSILIEYIKGNRTQLLDDLLDSDYELVINSIVVSEFLFHNLAIFGGKSPLALKEANLVATTMDSSKSEFLNLFSFIATERPIPVVI